MSLDSLCRWHVQVSVYCAWRLVRILGAPQCSILLHLMDICFLPCIYGSYRKSRLVCVWLSDLDLSRHHPLLRGAAPAIKRVRMAGLLNNCKSGPHCWGREVPTAVCIRWDSSSVCRRCCLELALCVHHILWSNLCLKKCNNSCYKLTGLPQLWMLGHRKMLIEMLWVGVCNAALSLDQNGIKNL